MINNSFHEYVFIRVCIALLRLVAPLSILYLLVSFWTRHFLLYHWITAIAVLESFFFFGVYLPRLYTIQLPPQDAPPPLTREQRKVLITKCFHEHPEVNEYHWDWFSSRDLRRDNLVKWLHWALFSRNDADPEWENEIDEYLAMIEENLNYKLPQGENSKTSSLRLNFDPVVAWHRPLIWYSIIMFLDTITALRIQVLGFKHYSTSGFFQVFPPRPFTSTSRQSVTPHLSYWHFSSTNSAHHGHYPKKPLVFIHGIGVGLHPYIPFFQELVHQQVSNDIIVIELLPISSHITNPIPSRLVMLEAINDVLTSVVGSDCEAVLASHSYGTVVAGHIIRWQNTASPQERQKWKALSSIHQQLFVDPIPFMLHLPNIARNFLYREPKLAAEHQLHYFASRDPDIARVLGRHFFWQDNVLWKDDLFPSSGLPAIDKRKFVVVVAGRDQILPASAVVSYLGKIEVEEEENGKERLKVLAQDGIDHAQVFEDKSRRRPLVEALRGFCIET
ncbi:hypothetical protein DL96DRAFT_1523221 [Flagelloscypha sp. PMI_526]|nr:hypothetical protein DL96DRAFT_1523221 [Flagelloscypha sp. PMI_526]